ncbi:MAG TPA: glycosyltransferase family 4 protein [Spirochaetota bacterium]|nr:glycosyltransferase family 4 protein [Spirochaetota bacterium]
MNTPVQKISFKTVDVVFPKDSESIFNNSVKTFGGATVQLYNFARELSKYHHVNALVNEYENINFQDHEDLNILFTFNEKDNFLFKVVKFHSAVRKSKPQVIIQRGLSLFSSFLAIYCYFFEIKFIFMFAHDREARGRFQRNNRKNLLYPVLLKFATSLIVQNGYQRDHLPPEVSHKVNKIKNGFQINKNDMCIKDGVLWVGRLEPWKRPEILLDLAEKLPDKKFIMIAPVVKKHESYAEEIYARAAGQPNVEVIKFVNHNDIDRHFKCARLFVNTSLEEGFPNTFIQSCKNNTPIVSLKVNPDNCITRFNLGFCCDDNCDLLLSCTEKILSDDALFRTISSSVYTYAKENHSIEQNVKMLQKLI